MAGAFPVGRSCSLAAAIVCAARSLFRLAFDSGLVLHPAQSVPLLPDGFPLPGFQAQAFRRSPSSIARPPVQFAFLHRGSFLPSVFTSRGFLTGAFGYTGMTVGLCPESSGQGVLFLCLVHALVSGHLALELLHEEGREDAHDAEDYQHPAHRGLEQAAYVPIADTECAPQALFATAAVFKSNLRIR